MNADHKKRITLAMAAMAGFALLAACSAEAETPGEMFSDAAGDAAGTAADEVPIPDAAQSAMAVAERDCLLVVWDEQEEPNHSFDRANDVVEGGLISCATGTSASQFEAALMTIREAADRGDRDVMLSELDIPLLFIDDAGNRLDLADTELADTAFDDVFTPEMLSVLRQLELEDMTVVPEQGGFFELGAIWLSAKEPGGRPRLVTINRQALAEAASAE